VGRLFFFHFGARGGLNHQQVFNPRTREADFMDCASEGALVGQVLMEEVFCFYLRVMHWEFGLNAAPKVV
jgi:hypothetical protein